MWSDLIRTCQIRMSAIDAAATVCKLKLGDREKRTPQLTGKDLRSSPLPVERRVRLMAGDSEVETRIALHLLRELRLSA